MIKWIFLMMTLMPVRTLAGDVNVGKLKSSTCVACHGTVGISANALWPNLAGQKDRYLVEQMKAFRDGLRKSDLMSPVAKMLSDRDMEDLAAYFTQLKAEKE